MRRVGSAPARGPRPCALAHAHITGSATLSNIEERAPIPLTTMNGSSALACPFWGGACGAFTSKFASTPRRWTRRAWRVRLMLHRVRAHADFTNDNEPFLLSLAHFGGACDAFAFEFASTPRRRVRHMRRVHLMLRRVRAHADFARNDKPFLLSLAHLP